MTTDDRVDLAASGPEGATSLGYRRTVILGSAGAAIGALVGLLRYLPGLRLPGSVRSDYIPMALSTAACFLILSVALFWQARRPRQGFSLMAMGALVLLVTMFCLLDVVGNLVGRDINCACWAGVSLLGRPVAGLEASARSPLPLPDAALSHR